MAINANCDMCNTHFDQLEQPVKNGQPGQVQPSLETLNPALKVPGQIEHICQRCLSKLNEQARKIQMRQLNELNADLKEWLQNHRQAKIILPEE